MILKYRDKVMVVRNHLFWDIDIKKIGPLKNKRLIIERILTRGNLDEFAYLNNFYSPKVIKDVIVNIGSFDKKVLNNLSQFYSINKNKFKCIKKQSTLQHWNS